jgi:hypothetical protein
MSTEQDRTTVERINESVQANLDLPQGNEIMNSADAVATTYEVEPHIDMVAEAIAEAAGTQKPESERPNWFRRNLFNLSLGAFVIGGAATFATNPVDKLEHEVLQAAPWVGGGIATTEGMWIAGAAAMAAGAGKNIGNPLTLKGRWGEVASSTVDSKLFKAGLVINTIGAIGTAGFVGFGAASLPPETWPGAAGIVGADIASTVAIRAGIYKGMKNARLNPPVETVTVEKPEKEKAPKVKVRVAEQSDITRLAEIDLLLFEKAYGQESPSIEETEKMLSTRLANNPKGMFVAELDGKIEGFVSAFPTRKSIENFVSWEDSTNNGTLDGVVDPKGKYVYVTNMTVKHEAVEVGAEDMLIANMFANGIASGVEYGYFVSRMPQFKSWFEKQVADGLLSPDAVTDGSLTELANSYAGTRDENGKRIDKQLRMYEGKGFDLKRVVTGGFEDDASMDFGVICKADSPTNETFKKIKPLRLAYAAAIRQVAKNPKLLRKVL